MSCLEVALSWGPPEDLGHPPMHKFKLERTSVTEAGSARVHPLTWVIANADLDDEESAWLDNGLDVCFSALDAFETQCPVSQESKTFFAQS